MLGSLKSGRTRSKSTTQTRSRRHAATTTTTTTTTASRTSKRRGVQPLSLDESLSRKLGPSSTPTTTTTTTLDPEPISQPTTTPTTVPKTRSKTPFPDHDGPVTSAKGTTAKKALNTLKSKKDTTESPQSAPLSIHDSPNAPSRGVLPIKPLYDAFLGQSSMTSLEHSFNPDLSKAQLYEQSTRRFKKINALDLTSDPTSVTGQQLLNRNWGIQNVLSFLRTQKVSNMVVFDTSGQSVTCDYTVICDVASTKPMQALTSKIVALGRMNRAVGYEKFHAGDDPDGLWNIASMSHIVVHILTPAGRSAPMFQRVERRLLLDAKLIPLGEWDTLVDPWVRQDQELWDAQSNRTALEWDEKKTSVHSDDKKQSLYGQPPPPGYYIRVNKKSISPTYNHTSEEDDYNYLDLNEQHMNKIEFMKDLGYQDEDVQLDPEILGKALMGTVDLLPVDSKQGQDKTNLNTPGARKRAGGKTQKDAADDDGGGADMGDAVDFLKELELDAVDPEEDEEAPPHLLKKTQPKPTTKKTSTKATKGSDPHNAAASARPTATTKTTRNNKTPSTQSKSPFSSTVFRSLRAFPTSRDQANNKLSPTPRSSSSSSSLHNNNNNHINPHTASRRGFLTEGDYSDLSRRFSSTSNHRQTVAGNQAGSGDINELTIGAFTSFDLTSPSHHDGSDFSFATPLSSSSRQSHLASSQYHPMVSKPTPGLSGSQSSANKASRGTALGSLDDPTPVLGFDLMLLGADTPSQSKNSNAHQQRNGQSDYEHYGTSGNSSGAEMSYHGVEFGMAPTARPRSLNLPHHNNNNNNTKSSLHNDNALSSHHTGSGSGTEWFDDLGDITNENPDYFKCAFRNYDSLESLDNFAIPTTINSNSTQVIHNILSQQQPLAGASTPAHPLSSNSSSRHLLGDIDDDFFTRDLNRSLGGAENAASSGQSKMLFGTLNLSHLGAPNTKHDAHHNHYDDENDLDSFFTSHDHHANNPNSPLNDFDNDFMMAGNGTSMGDGIGLHPHQLAGGRFGQGLSNLALSHQLGLSHLNHLNHNHHSLSDDFDNDFEFDHDGHLGDALADHRDQMYPGLELDADDDVDLQRFSRLLTTQRHRTLHHQQLVKNQLHHSTGWTDPDDLDGDDDDDDDDEEEEEEDVVVDVKT